MLIKKCVLRISVLILFVSSTLIAQNRTADFGLIGEVESVQSVTKLAQNPTQTEVSGFLDSEFYDSIYLKFDRRRNLVLRENYLDYRGKLGIYDRTVFQINGFNQIEKLETTLIQNGEEPRKVSQKKKFYYLKNLLARMDEWNFGRTSDQYWVTNSVYEKGRLVEKVIWMEDQIFSRNKYRFDFNNEILQEKSFSNNGKLNKTIDFEYDNFGQLIKKITQSGNENTIETFQYGRAYLLERQLMEKSGKVLRKEIYSETGFLEEIQKYNYQTKQIDHFHFDFILDEKNNWTDCFISKNNVPLYSMKRKIKYYK